MKQRLNEQVTTGSLSYEPKALHGVDARREWGFETKVIHGGGMVPNSARQPGTGDLLVIEVSYGAAIGLHVEHQVDAPSELDVLPIAVVGPDEIDREDTTHRT